MTSPAILSAFEQATSDALDVCEHGRLVCPCQQGDES